MRGLNVHERLVTAWGMNLYASLHMGWLVYSVACLEWSEGDYGSQPARFSGQKTRG